MKTIVVDSLTFAYDNATERARAESLLTKEPGTIAWLNELRDGDVFYDVGANVGCYALYAARIVGPTGQVYAFEPHPATRAALQRNIAANGFRQNVTVIAAPLARRSGIQWLQFERVESGGSNNQLRERDHGRCGELVVATTLDEIHDRAPLRSPIAIKIDVDGLERDVLAGAERMLQLGKRPARVQVESVPEQRQDLIAEMALRGYACVGSHFTALCLQQIRAGATPRDVVSNELFRLREAA